MVVSEKMKESGSDAEKEVIVWLFPCRKEASTFNTANDVIQQATILEAIEDGAEWVTKRHSEEHSISKWKARTPDEEDIANGASRAEFETDNDRNTNGMKEPSAALQRALRSCSCK